MKSLPKQSNINEIVSHRTFLSNERKTDINSLSPGDVVRFMYDGEERTVFVVNPEWQLMLHGLSMNVISRQDLMLEVISKGNIKNDVWDFYNKILKTDRIKKIDCYRTYKIEKIQNLHRFDYQTDDGGFIEL